MISISLGLLAVDEDELDAVQKSTESAEANSVAVEKLEDKVNKIYNAVLPLLTNLKRIQRKTTYIVPNRNLKIDQFEVVLQKIINE